MLCIKIICFNGEGLRGEEKMPVISSIPLRSKGRWSRVTPVRLRVMSIEAGKQNTMYIPSMLSDG